MPRISVLAPIGLLLLPTLAAAVPPAPPKLTVKTQSNSSECSKPCPSRTQPQTISPDSDERAAERFFTTQKKEDSTSIVQQTTSKTPGPTKAGLI
jgi:hypothetical protein